MTLNNDAKFEGKPTFVFKNDMRNSGNFYQSTWKSQNLDLDEILLNPKKKMYELKIYKVAICHDIEKKMQNWKRNWLAVSKLRWGLWWILTRALKNLKNLHFNGLPLNKVYNV